MHRRDNAARRNGEARVDQYATLIISEREDVPAAVDFRAALY
jgi:hypothetical protein